MRRRRPESRKILPDPVFKDIQVAKFVNYIMNDGKKGVAESIFYGSLEIINIYSNAIIIMTSEKQGRLSNLLFTALQNALRKWKSTSLYKI